ncbi:Fructosamine kinase-domain-containing protein [Hypoxylon crocopeplum]|nr:Fructosamine kinase-domain-containing protein [Hypoxylon crocopeplum]
MVDEESQSTREPDVPIGAIQVVDPEVITKLPPGTHVLKIAAHGASFWARTARLDVEQDGIRKEYFLKTSSGELGRDMVASEYHCMSKVRAVAPDLVPEVIAWGTYADMSNVHFLLCEFRVMTGQIPPAEALAERVAELHCKSSSAGGNSRFGSDVPTFHGNVRVEHGWSDSWEGYFARTTRVLFELEQEAQGDNEVIRQMMVPFFEKVIPRLLRPLQTGGRSIHPSLIHGDLWHGNAETDGTTGLPIIFDAASFYAHNEYELGVWRQPWNEINEAYRAAYHKHFPKSQPKEDCDYRNALYAVRVNVLDSILYKDDPSYRQMLISGMCELIDKFPGGFEEWEASQGKHRYE